MINYTTRYVNIVSFLITMLIYIFLMKSNMIISNVDFSPPFIFNILKRNTVLVELNSNNINQETADKSTESQDNLPLKNIEETKEKNWKIVIPKISLEAEISEGTSKSIMDKYVGHFEETSKNNGNIGLAAHNRGYDVNYFAQIKSLRNGDEIIYKFYNFEKTYTVVENRIIKDTDWSYLEDTKDNRITLITCVENEPEYRRCIQGIEKNGIS